MLLLLPWEAGWAGAGSAENKSTRPELGWLTADVVYGNKERTNWNTLNSNHKMSV